MSLEPLYAFGQFYKFTESKVRGNLNLICWESGCNMMDVFGLCYWLLLVQIKIRFFLIFGCEDIIFLFVFHHFKSPKISLTVSPNFIIAFLEIFSETNEICIILVVFHAISNDQLNISVDLFNSFIARWGYLSFYCS